MANKFNRNYKLTIQSNAAPVYYKKDLLNRTTDVRLIPSVNTTADNKPNFQEGETLLVIKPPFTIEVKVRRAIGSSDNVADIKIYGLNEKSRNELFKDAFNLPYISLGTPYRKVILEGGYGDKLYPIFIGVLIEGHSTREGVDQVTSLHCVSSGVGLYNTFINQSYGANTKESTVLNGVMDELIKDGSVEKGAITQLDGTYESGVLAQGMTFNVLSQFGVDVFVDLNRINALKFNEVLGSIDPKNIFTINSDTGLLGSPIRNQAKIILNTIFEPKVRLGSLINIESDTVKFVNGIYKIVSIEHTGVFSGTKEGKLITTLGLFIGDKSLNNWQSIEE